MQQLLGPVPSDLISLPQSRRLGGETYASCSDLVKHMVQMTSASDHWEQVCTYMYNCGPAIDAKPWRGDIGKLLEVSPALSEYIPSALKTAKACILTQLAEGPKVKFEAAMQKS